MAYNIVLLYHTKRMVSTFDQRGFSVNTIQIGPVTIEQTACLAPMASVADRTFRALCRSYGAAMVTGEMASAKGMMYSDKKTAELLEVTGAERPMAVQLFGDDPHFMALAAEKAMRYHPDLIDINMGCPVPKVVANNSGSALMKHPKLAGEILRAVAGAVPVPVTAKIRTGWDDSSLNAVELAKILEQSGAAAITVHGRTRQQMYHPPVNLDMIRLVKEAVAVPVIGNGDIETPEDAKRMYEQTGCDLVMVGRGSYGRPWLFSQIKEYLETGRYMPDPPLEERLLVLRRHIELLCAHKGEKMGMREARKHAGWYLKGLHGAAGFRRACGALSELCDADALIEEVLRQNAAGTAE